MWIINADGDFAKNEETGATCRIAHCSDKLYRVKRNYKTIGTFTKMTDARNFLAETVRKWNEAEK